MELEIVPYHKKLAKHFVKLNIDWLERYFYVEPKDQILLENCEESIIAKGGYIFFAKYAGAVAGCFALIPMEEKQYELGKMAVDPKYQGLKIGQRLLEFAITFALEHQWKRLQLYSSTKLPTALYVYRKYGFREIALEKNNPYLRSDIKMELIL